MKINKKWQINILNFTKLSLNNLIKILKENEYSSTQIINWIYKNDISNFYLMSNIKKNLKEKINKIAKIATLKKKKELIDKDNTIKFLIYSKDLNTIETVVIPNSKNHFTICVSSQVGCLLNCSFCATGKSGFLRNLKCYEIISQIIIAKNYIQKNFFQKKITNIVMMGMGEPLLNINNVLSFISIIKEKDGININKNKITISTSGIADKINILEKEIIPLALSLHATNNKLRSKIMPINKKFKIEKIISECKKYSIKNTLTIEYIMIKNLNDSLNNAKELVKLLKDIKCKICLIPFNKVDFINFKPSTKETINAFQALLKKNNINTNIRKRKGFYINGACGQLAGLLNKNE